MKPRSQNVSAVGNGKVSVPVEEILASPKVQRQVGAARELAAAVTLDLELVELLRECKRRIEQAAGSNSDDWRWYQNQARQTLRALGPKIDAALKP